MAERDWIGAYLDLIDELGTRMPWVDEVYQELCDMLPDDPEAEESAEIQVSVIFERVWQLLPDDGKPNKEMLFREVKVVLLQFQQHGFFEPGSEDQTTLVATQQLILCANHAADRPL